MLIFQGEGNRCFCGMKTIDFLSEGSAAASWQNGGSVFGSWIRVNLEARKKLNDFCWCDFLHV